LALAQFFSALYYINGGKSEIAARFAVAAFATCQSFQDSRMRIPVSIWQRIYALRAALEDTEQHAWEGYSQLIIKDKTDPGRERPYDLLAHVALVFLFTSNVFKNMANFNLPADVPGLHTRMTELKELDIYLKSLVPNPTYDKQVSLGYFFLQSTMALLSLQYIKLHELTLDEGLRQVHECLTEARAHLTRVTGIKCCPALSLAIWLDTAMVKKLLELGKEVPNTLEAWSLLHSVIAPVVEERDKYPDNYCAPLNKLFAAITSAANRELAATKNSTAYPPSNYYNANTFYQSPLASPASVNVGGANNFQLPPRSLTGYTADQSYRSTPFGFNEQYSKSVMTQYHPQYARPNYAATSPSHSPSTTRQQYAAPSQYAAHTNSTSANSFTSDPHSHSH
jgi:hypothetical protein